MKANHIRQLFRKMRCHIKTIFALPDYEKYLAHQKRRHPGKPVMTEKEYYLFALKERYESGKVNRCC